VMNFFDWCRQQMQTALPKSGLGEAVQYVLNQTQPLSQYLEDGRLSIGRVEVWRGDVGSAYLFPALSVAGASRVEPCSVSTPRSSNRTCRFPASGSHPGLRPSHSAWPCAPRAA
jgi:hypothetical protein